MTKVGGTLILMITVVAQSLLCQNTINNIDDRYREDQFYASITYNILTNLTNDIVQNGFSTGFHLGFLRDMPINKRRNLAIGLGLGLSSNSYNQNLQIKELNNSYSYSIIDESTVDSKKNKFTTYLVEFPLEFRWRTSTANTYKFWRIYTGFKFGYLLYNSSKFKSDSGNILLSNVADFHPYQYGITFSAGYGTWNFHAYYGLNPIFDNSALLNNASINIASLKIGLIFYIL